MTPRCRIYLFTYNRNDLLPRAVKSLLDQTFKNWVCELHNDMPDDEFPQAYISGIQDSRISVINHAENLGPVHAFNLAFNDCSETYISILEDDNWWEPQFLEKMISILDRQPKIQVAWANMKLHQELPGNKWEFTGNTIWPLNEVEPTRLFDFPQPRQAFGAMHSNGAMLVRSGHLDALQTPDNIRFDFVEPIRERAFSYPIMLVNEPLANFALTISTSRLSKKEGLHEHYYLLLASFFLYAGNKKQLIREIWAELRKSSVRATHNLLYVAILDKNCRGLTKYATLTDWLFFFAYNLRYPSVLIANARAKRTHQELWEYLVKNTGLRFRPSN